MIKKIDLQSYIEGKVMSILNEEEGPQVMGDDAQQQENVGYTVDTFITDKELRGHGGYVIPAMTRKLTELKAMCDKHQIEFEWEITRVDNDETKKHGWKISANAAMPDLKVEGYTYIGSVVPLVDDYALVAPSKEFKDNFEVLDKIKTTVAREKCAGCNRVAERGVYYVFREDATGDLKKFGSNCAKRYLGISVDASVNKVFTYLYNAIQAEGMFLYGSEEGFGGGGRGGDWRPRGYDEVAAACTYFALFGIPEARFSFKYCNEYNQLHTYYMTIDAKEPSYTSFQEEVNNNQVKINSYISSFYSNIYDFCQSFNAQSDFDESVKSHGLFLGGVNVTKAAARYFRPGIYPYVALKYFQAKRDEGIEVTSVEEFYGTKPFDVTILNKDEKRRAEGNGVYLQIYAKTDNNEYIAWCQDEDNPSLAIGKKATVYGEYGGENGKYCMLRRVKVMGESEIQQRDERAAVVYPEDGTRLRSVEMTVLKSSANYVIFKDENGCEYFVSNTRKNRYGEVEGFVVQEWAQVFKPGNTIRLTGTVNSYVDRFGETKHTLKRVDYDRTSFPEIDWSQYSMDELIYDKKKIILGGSPVDVTDAREINDLYVVQLRTEPHNAYSVYDPSKQEIIYKGDWNQCCNFAKFEKITVEKMKEKNIIILKTEQGYEVDSPCYWAKKFGDSLDQFVQKGNIHLVEKHEKGMHNFIYYDPTTKKIINKVSLKTEECSEENMTKILNRMYDALPEPAMSINENDIMEMVIKCLSSIIKG